MTNIIEITDTYPTVLEKLNLPAKFSGPEEIEKYIEQINKDLSRTCYANFTGSVADQQEGLRCVAHLNDSKASYTQGNFDARIFPGTYINLSRRYHKRTLALYINDPINNPREGLLDSVGFAYVNDDGVNCGFVLFCVRDDPDTDNEDVNVPLEERKRHFMVSIIRNTTGVMVK